MSNSLALVLFAVVCAAELICGCTWFYVDHGGMLSPDSGGMLPPDPLLETTGEWKEAYDGDDDSGSSSDDNAMEKDR